MDPLAFWEKTWEEINQDHKETLIIQPVASWDQLQQ